MTDETKLPHSEEAEKAVISCVLLDGAPALVKAMDAKIAPDWFHEDKNARLWKAILWNHSHGRPLETHVIVDELRKAGRLELIGVPHILSVSKAQPTGAQFAHWLNVLRDTYVLRELIRAADDVKIAALNYQGNPEDFVAACSRILSIRHASEKQETLQTASASVFDLCERILRGEETEQDKGLSWPWEDWNKRFGSAQPGELIVVGARPGRGKSSAGRQAAWHWTTKLGGDVLLFSREMPLEGLPQLFAQGVAQVSWRNFRRRETTKEQSREFMDALKAVKANGKLHIFDRDRTIAQITARIKAFSQMTPIKAIVIDYLQRYDPQQEKGETRDVAIGRMTMALKDAAIEHKCPVLLLAQISRTVERDNRDPMLSDLRESGNIEQDADRVIFLHAPTELPDGTAQDLNDGSKPRLYCKAIQAKGRGEGQDTCDMTFIRNTTTFASYAP